MEWNEDRLKGFINSAVERHRVYLKKEAGESKPWSEDPLYQKYFFCNVFRQYDKCSKWMIENILPYRRWDLIIVYRYISTYETFERLKHNVPLDDIEKIHNYLREMYLGSERLFTGCFLRNPMVKGEVRKAFQVPFYVVKEIKEDGGIKGAINLQSLELLVSYLCRFSATAGFMAYEYACDLEYTDYFNPEDKYTWCNKGPGAQQGLNLLTTGKRHGAMSQDKFLDGARELFGIMKSVFNKEFPNEDLSMREVEHWLCEFQKYLKYKEMHEQGAKCKFRHYRGGY